MKVFYSLAICAALMMTSCDNENGNGDIVLTGDTPKEIVVKADDNGNSQAIKFTAVAPWTATVKDVTPSRSDSGSEVEWIKLSAYNGEAGDVSLDLSFSKNLTGATRIAEILIQCGKTTIKITIEQVAENADGTVTKQINSITCRWEYNSESIENPGIDPVSESTVTYKYDDNGRVSRVISDDNYETIYDYTIVDEIQVTSRESYSGETNEEKYIVTLNDKGNAVKIRQFDSYENKYYDKNTVSYTEDGRISQITNFRYDNGETCKTNITYNNGYITGITEKGDNGYTDNTYEFDIPTFYPNKYPNNNMIDMISFYQNVESLNIESISMLSTIGRLGKTSDYFIERGKRREYAYDENMETSYEKPGTVIRESNYTNINFEGYDDIYSCEYDNDNNLKKVIITSKFDVEEISYKIVVSDEIAETTEEGINIYFCKKTDYKRVKTDEGEDITTYTINY